jgi:hypothetical protein
MKYTWLILLSVSTLIASAQKPVSYKELKDDNSINFYEVCKVAEAHFDTIDKMAKGSGFKGFERWKNANEYKFFPDGNRSQTDPYFVENTFEKFQATQPKSSFDNGWNELGPITLDSTTGNYAPGLGRVQDFYVNPNNPNLMYLGSRSGGFHRSTNGGISWTGGHTDFLVASGVDAIGVSPTNPDSVIINLKNARNGYSHGVYRSTDGGLSWTQTNFNPTTLGFGGLGSNFVIYKVAYHPTVANLIIICTNKGIFRSEDNLQTWTNQMSTYSIEQLEFHPTNPDIIYVYDDYGSSGNQDVLLKSTDRGINYYPTADLVGNGGSNVYISVSAACPSCLYAASSNGVWKSYNEGDNFEFTINPDESCLGFAVNDQDTLNMIYGYVDIEVTTDGGYSFDQNTWWSLGSAQHGSGNFQENLNSSSVYVHADLHPAKSINGIFYVGTDGLFAKSIDQGVSWEVLSDGLGIRENYKLGVSQSNHYKSISGSQDNGSSLKTKEGWIEFYGADGMEGIIHPLNDNWIISSFQYGGRRRSKNGGQTTDNGAPANETGSANAQWEAPFCYDPNNHMTLYHFSNEVHRSDDFGDTWTEIGSPSLFGGMIKEATVAQNNSQIMVIASGSIIEKSTDGGVTFTDIRNGLPSWEIESVAFAPNNDSIIAVTYARYQIDNQKIYISYDGGDSWVNETANLGDMPLRAVVIDHSNEQNIYVGGEIGIYTKPMYGTTWTLYNPNLPNTTIEEMEIVNGSNTLKAATWGRGLWEYTTVGRNDFPSILITTIDNVPSDVQPMEGNEQFVTSIVAYDNTLTSVYTEWSANTPDFGNIIQMNNTVDSTWKSVTALPAQPVGTKMYFKVFAVGATGDTTETYKFMYTVKPFEFCTGSGTMTYQGNITLVDFNSINKPTGKTQPYSDYTATDSTDVSSGQTYDLTINLNTDNGNYSYYSRVWIDWNHDADFSGLNETYDLGFSNNIVDGPTSLSPLAVTVPNFAEPGATRMRVACQYNQYPEPCADGVDGEVEDYLLIVDNTSISIEELKPVKITPYPNPVDTWLTLKLDQYISTATINIFDGNGKLVSTFKQSEFTELRVNFSDYSAGLYYIHLNQNGNNSVVEIIKN